MPAIVNKMCTVKCAFGTAPAPLSLTTNTNVNVGKVPAATIFDSAPMANIPSFGMCITLSNPQTAAQTAAALGVLTPAPCVPVVPGPWSAPKATVTIKGKTLLSVGSTNTCVYGGVISIVSPGQQKGNV